MDSKIFKKWIYFGLCFWALCQPWSIAGASIGLAVTALALLAYGLSSHSFPSLQSPLVKPLWIYFLIGILVSIFGIDFRHSWGEIQKEGQMLLDFYIFSGAFALEGSLSILGFWAAGFFIAALMGIGQVAGFFGPVVIRDLLFRVASVSKLWAFLEPTTRAHGTLYAVTYGELLGLAFLGWFCHRVFRPKRQFLSLFFFLSVGVALILSGTRGAWLGVFVGMLVIVTLEFNKRMAFAMLAVMAFSVVAISLCPRFPGAAQAFNPRELSFSLHRQLWAVAWRIFLDHPLFGVGVRNFGELSCRYNHALFCGQLWDQADNFYLNQLAERGIVGFAATALLFGTMLRQAWLTYKRSRSFLSLWFLSWICAFLFMSVTECAWRRVMIWVPTIALYCWMERRGDDGEFQSRLERSF